MICMLTHTFSAHPPEVKYCSTPSPSPSTPPPPPLQGCQPHWPRPFGNLQGRFWTQALSWSSVCKGLQSVASSYSLPPGSHSTSKCSSTCLYDPSSGHCCRTTFS